jgi:integrase
MARLAVVPGVDARALEFCILTAARSREVIGARWAEIDFAAAVWTIPANRTKRPQAASRAARGTRARAAEVALH